MKKENMRKRELDPDEFFISVFITKKGIGKVGIMAKEREGMEKGQKVHEAIKPYLTKIEEIVEIVCS
jgi:hypothetical protein